MSRHSSGFTLVEMLVVMFVTTTLLGIGTQMIHRTMRAEKYAREQVDAARATATAAAQFRSDARAAASASNDEQRGDLVFQCGDQRQIVWHADSEGLQRTESGDDAPVRREFYRLPPSSRAVCAFDEQTGRVQLLITHVTANGETTRHEAQVVATPGRLSKLGLVMEDSP